ncbi:hypothetical protein [uncultured Clostridium sp.]|nr:hypothetical protein [uncultured Clostridium sp.]
MKLNYIEDLEMLSYVIDLYSNLVFKRKRKNIRYKDCWKNER